MTATNQGFVDRYSIPHAAWGILFAASGVPPALAVASHVTFELAEDGLKDALEPVWPDATHDSTLNHVGDVVCFTAGYYATRALRQKPLGVAVLSAFVALAAGIWMSELFHRKLWAVDGV